MELKRITPERIIAAACIHFEVSEAELKNRQRSRDISYRRKICFYIIRGECFISFYRIAVHFGFSDHAAVLRSVNEIEIQKTIYTQIRHDIECVKNIAVKLPVGNLKMQKRLNG